MIMNYVLSFCRITAASRIFSRNFYLPLLKPLTPKDAKRTLKITGKWLLGSRIHHYIPVLMNHRKKRSKRAKNYGRVVHRYNSSYSYAAPVLNGDNESHKLLDGILGGKKDEGLCYVYTVEDKMCNIVFPSKYELAIRDGDIIDVLVSQSDDKVLIKLRNFKKVAVQLEYYESEGVLYKGEGATSAEEEKFHHHGRLTMSLAKIFEAKELAEEWEMEMMRIVARKRKQKGEGSKEWNDMVSESMRNLDWQKFEVDAKKVIDQISEPAREEHIGMEVEDLDKTRNVAKFFARDGLGQLPTMAEIPDVVKCMGSAVYEELEYDGGVISGVRVTLSSGKECFVPGQMVKSDEGDIFVPGQTIENEFGVSYAPGFTINMDGGAALIKGLIMGEEDQQKPMFLPTESSITPEGELTFCRNPQEKSKAKPKKIFVKRGDRKKRKVKKAPLEDVVEAAAVVVVVESPEPVVPEEEDVTDVTNVIVEEQTEEVEVQVAEAEVSDGEEVRDVLVEEPFAEAIVLVDAESMTSEEERPFDDGMDKLLSSLEDKKSELERKIEALRKLTVTLENCVTYVSQADSDAAAAKLTTETDKLHKLSEILLTLTRRVSTFRERYDMNLRNITNPSLVYPSTFVTEGDEKYHGCSHKLKVCLKSAVYAANEVFKTRPKDQLLALNTLADILHNDEGVLDELCALMATNLDRNEITSSIFKELVQVITENKLDVLASALNSRDADAIVEKMSLILDAEVCGAFRKLAKNSPHLPLTVMDHVRPKIDLVKTELGAAETLQACVVSATKEYLNESLPELSDELISEAVGLANTLGMYEVEENLSAENCPATKPVKELLKRFILMRKLCERDYSIKTSLQRIAKHPECGRKDPRIRQLLIESSKLLCKSREMRSSLEVPLRLFQEQNFLAIEDCVNLTTRITQPVLISRKGIQAVVPMEESKNVLAGRVPYTLVDESGVANFKPVHMFSKLGRKTSVDVRRRSLSNSRMTA